MIIRSDDAARTVITYDAYQIGAEVTHAWKTWTSTVANNVWEPGVYGWKDIGDTTGS